MIRLVDEKYLFHVREITLFLDQNAENTDDFDDQYSNFSDTGN